MPGNAGGAKGPDFWRASEDGEVEVIGDEPGNSVEDWNCSRLLCRGTKESYPLCRLRARLVHSPCVPRHVERRIIDCNSCPLTGSNPHIPPCRDVLCFELGWS
jgi:hypothetical protein